MSQTSAVKSLADDKQITIKQEDKGGTIVIMLTTDYDDECIRQLANRNYYTPVNVDASKRLSTQIAPLVSIAETHDWIIKHEADFLVNAQPRIPYYMSYPKSIKASLLHQADP